MTPHRSGLSLMLVLGLLASGDLASAAPIRVLALDESRVGVSANEFGSINFNFATGGGFQAVRESLLDPANFGTGGTVARPVQLSSVGQLTPEALAQADVVVFGLTAPLSPDEETALDGFLLAGGGLLYFGNWSAEGFAQSRLGVTPDGLSGSRAWVADPDSPLVDGPFGVFGATPEDPMWLMWNQSMGDLGPYGRQVIVNAEGRTFGASFEYGRGRVVLFTDEEFLMSPPGVPYIAAPNMAPRNLTLFLNSFAYVVPAETEAVPEPASLLLLSAGLAGAASRLRRKLH